MKGDMEKSLIESESCRGVKRPLETASENNVDSPPKLVTTPRTRSRALDEMTPKTIPDTGPKSKLPIRVCTPKSSTKDLSPEFLKVPKSKTRRCRSITPESSDKQGVRTRSRTNTPVMLKEPESRTSRSRSQTPVTSSSSKPSRSRSRTPVSMISKLETPSRSARSKTPQKISSQDGLSLEKPGRVTRNSPRLCNTPKISKTSSDPRSQDVRGKTPNKPEITQRRSRSRTPNPKVLDTAVPVDAKIAYHKETSETICESEIRQNDFNKNVEEDEQINTVPTNEEDASVIAKTSDHTSLDCLASVDNNVPEKDLPPASISIVNTVPEGTVSARESSIPESSEELQEELEKVKKRRSTLGRGRKSGQSLGGRRSLCPVLPILSLEDQIETINRGLPRTSQVSILLDISIREAMRRLEERFQGAECISDLRLNILTNSENIGGHVAYKIAGMPLEVDTSIPKKTKNDFSQRSEKLSFYKRKTMVLEQEYKSWKALLKARKLACQDAEREFREAKSGETKIDEDIVKHLTTVQRKILEGKSNYSQYVKEVEMARETAYFATLELNQTASIVANFMKSSKAVADTCYSAVEMMTIGPLKRSPSESAMKALLTLENGC